MPIKDIFYTLIVIVSWAGNFIAAKYTLAELPPITSSAIRFALVALLLVPFVKIPHGNMQKIFGVALTLGTIHFSLVFTGIYQGLDVSTSVIAVQTGVPFSCLLGVFFFKDELGWRRILGLICAFAGMVVLLGAPNAQENMGALGLVVLGAFFWALSNMQLKHITNTPILAILGWAALISAPQLALLGWWLEADLLQQVVWQNVSISAWAGLLYTVLASTILAYGLWYALLARHPLTILVPFTLLIPIVATGMAALWLNEVISWRTIAGGMMVLAGVATIVLRKPRTIRPAGAPQ